MLEAPVRAGLRPRGIVPPLRDVGGAAVPVRVDALRDRNPDVHFGTDWTVEYFSSCGSQFDHALLYFFGFTVFGLTLIDGGAGTIWGLYWNLRPVFGTPSPLYSGDQ